MTRALVARAASKLLSLGVKARTIVLTLLLGMAIGSWATTAFAYALVYARPQAVAILSQLNRFGGM